MSDLQKFLVTVFFQREKEYQDLVFVISCEHQDLAEKEGRSQIKILDKDAEVLHVSVRHLNTVLSNPFYKIEKKAGSNDS